MFACHGNPQSLTKSGVLLLLLLLLLLSVTSSTL
jgi:hypothetical protein